MSQSTSSDESDISSASEQAGDGDADEDASSGSDVDSDSDESSSEDAGDTDETGESESDRSSRSVSRATSGTNHQPIAGNQDGDDQASEVLQYRRLQVKATMPVLTAGDTPLAMSPIRRSSRAGVMRKRKARSPDGRNLQWVHPSA